MMEKGSHEARMFQAVDKDKGLPQAELMVCLIFDNLYSVCE